MLTSLFFSCSSLSSFVFSSLFFCAHLLLCSPLSSFVLVSLFFPPSSFVLTSLFFPLSSFVLTSPFFCVHLLLCSPLSSFVLTFFCAHPSLLLCSPISSFVLTFFCAHLSLLLCAPLSSFVLTSLFFCAHLSLLSPPLPDSMHLPQALINPTRPLHPLVGCQCSESAPTGVNYLACKREPRRGDGAENLTRRRAALGRRRGARALFGPLRSDSVNESEP